MCAYSVKHIYDPNKGTLIRQFAGEVIMADVINAWQKDIDNGVVNRNLNGVVSDFTNCYNKVTMGELDKIVEFYRYNIDIFKSLKNAVVLDTPGVAVILMFEQDNKEFKHKAFCTLGAALEWVSH